MRFQPHLGSVSRSARLPMSALLPVVVGCVAEANDEVAEALFEGALVTVIEMLTPLAMGSGTDAAMHASGVTLMRGDPRLVAAAIDISRRTYAKIRQNLFWAFIYNVVGIPLAALGLLSPVVAGAAMALSSVSVVTNALLLKRWKPGA